MGYRPNPGEVSMTTTKNIAKGGIFTAVSVFCLYLSTILPTSNLYLLGIACCIIPISILMTNVKNSIIVYAATSLLGFLLLGFRWNIFAYIIFFGTYGFAKLYIEKLNNIILEIVLKLVFFNICMAFIYYLIINIFILNIFSKFPLLYVIIGIQPVFIICDYAITLFIAYIKNHLLKNMQL